MLFSADKNFKENLYNMYKKDAEDYVEKKKMDKLRKQEEERKYLSNMQRNYDEENYKKRLEKANKVNLFFNEYHDMMDKQKV